MKNLIALSALLTSSVIFAQDLYKTDLSISTGANISNVDGEIILKKDAQELANPTVITQPTSNEEENPSTKTTTHQFELEYNTFQENYDIEAQAGISTNYNGVNNLNLGLNGNYYFTEFGPVKVGVNGGYNREAYTVTASDVPFSLQTTATNQYNFNNQLSTVSDIPVNLTGNIDGDVNLRTNSFNLGPSLRMETEDGKFAATLSGGFQFNTFNQSFSANIPETNSGFATNAVTGDVDMPAEILVPAGQEDQVLAQFVVDNVEDVNEQIRKTDKLTGNIALDLKYAGDQVYANARGYYSANRKGVGAEVLYRVPNSPVSVGAYYNGEWSNTHDDVVDGNLTGGTPNISRNEIGGKLLVDLNGSSKSGKSKSKGNGTTPMGAFFSTNQ